MVFLLQYQTRWTTFSNNIFSFIHVHQILCSKNVPYFSRLSTKLACKMPKNPKRIFIKMEKSIEFHLSHNEIPQLSSLGGSEGLYFKSYLTWSRMLLWRLRLWLWLRWLLTKFWFWRFSGIGIVFAINFVSIKVTIELGSGVIRDGGQGPRRGHVKVTVAYVSSSCVGRGCIFRIVGRSERSVAG